MYLTCIFPTILHYMLVLRQMPFYIPLKIAHPILIQIFYIGLGHILGLQILQMRILQLFRMPVDIQTTKYLTKIIDNNRIIMNQLWGAFLYCLEIQLFVGRFFVERLLGGMGLGWGGLGGLLLGDRGDEGLVKGAELIFVWGFYTYAWTCWWFSCKKIVGDLCCPWVVWRECMLRVKK